MSTTELPAAVAAAAARIRDSMRKQEVEVLDSFGTALGPPSPRPDRADLHLLLAHFGLWDDDLAEGVCNDDLALWGAVLHCVREPGHLMGEGETHRSSHGVTWSPR